MFLFFFEHALSVDVCSKNRENDWHEFQEKQSLVDTD